MPYKIIGGKATHTNYSSDEVFARIKNEAIRWINQQDKVDDTIKDLTYLHRQLRKNAGERAAQIIEKAVAS